MAISSGVISSCMDNVRANINRYQEKMHKIENYRRRLQNDKDIFEDDVKNPVHAYDFQDGDLWKGKQEEEAHEKKNKANLEMTVYDNQIDALITDMNDAIVKLVSQIDDFANGNTVTPDYVETDHKIIDVVKKFKKCNSSMTKVMLKIKDAYLETDEDASTTLNSAKGEKNG